MASFYAPSSHSFRVFDQNKENTFPTKTPGRALGRSVGGKDAIKAAGSRTAGPKTANGKLGFTVAGPSTVYKDVNVMATGRKPGTEVRNGKGKQLAGGSNGGEGTPGADIEPKRLFAQQLPPAAQVAPTTSKLAAPPTARKAPAPVRDFSTPHINKTLPARTPAPAAVQTNLTTPLPSATRARRRSRQSTTPNSNDGLAAGSSDLLHVGPGTAQSYMTPQRGTREDDSFELGDESFGMDDDRAGNVSSGSVKIGGSASLENLVEEEESDGEVEYMPPKVVPLPDDPPFPMPDFKQIGRNILANPCMGMWEEEPGEVPVLHLSHTWEDVKAGGYVEDGDEKEQYTIKKKTDLEDPIFAALEARKKTKAAATKPLVIVRSNVPSSTKPTSSFARRIAPNAHVKMGSRTVESRQSVGITRPTASNARPNGASSSTVRPTSRPIAQQTSRPAARLPHAPAAPSKLRQALPTTSRPVVAVHPSQPAQAALTNALNDRGVDLEELEKMAAGMMMNDEDFEFTL